MDTNIWLEQMRRNLIMKKTCLQPFCDIPQNGISEEALVNMSDSCIIRSTVPTTPLLSMRTEVGHFFK